MKSLTGQVAVVTGSGRGIGKTVALTLAEEGADIVAVSRTSSEIEKTATEVRALGRQALAIQADVTDGDEVSQMARKILDNFGSVDILVNNAGGGDPGTAIEELSESRWSSIVDINLKGAFLCSQALGRLMIEQKHGKIINIASVAAHKAAPRLSAYCAAKAGVLKLTEVMALEWAKHNINVNAVSPGLTETEAVKQGFDAGLLANRLKSIPLGRLSQTQDIANAVLFLASAGSRNITGQVIIVDGGESVAHAGYV